MLKTSGKIASAIALALMFLGLAGVAPAADQGVFGKKLVMKDDDDASRRKIVWKAKDIAITLPTGMDAPNIGGATLQVLNPISGESDTYSLPASGWTPFGSPIIGYRYFDRSLVASPVISALIRGGLVLAATVKGSQ